MKIHLLTGLLLFSFFQMEAQLGCTDPQATNYDVFAITNDGSCSYPDTDYTLSFITELSDGLIENSGLLVLPQGLYTHNDAGNPDEIYRIDSLDGSILQTLLVVGDNEDWEDIAESETHIFLGDFGNNDGNRENLRVYKIAKSELANNIVNAQPINFSYLDQTDFTHDNNDHDYDCEAFFYHDDSLHLFTKNWVDNQTRHYIIPAEPGYYPVLPRHTFDVDGLITGADISEEGTVLLLGYTESGLNFMWMLFDYPGNEFFSGNKRRIELGSGFVNSQTEGIAFKDKFQGYISSEKFDQGPIELPPKLLAFNIEQWMSEMVSVKEKENNYDIKAYPNPFANRLSIELPNNWPEEEIEIRVLNTSGKLMQSKKVVYSGRDITVEVADNWSAGVYVIQLLSGKAFWQKRVIKF